MSDCRDKRFQEMLFAYEAGMLDEQDQRALHIHILECESCRHDLMQFSNAAKLIRRDPDVRRKIFDLADIEPVPAARPIERKRASPRRWRPTFIPVALAAAAVFLILLFKPWQIEIRPTHEAVAVENRLAVMYFDNLADQDDPQRLGEIAANLLITDLSESAYLQVVSGQLLYDILRRLGREGQRKIDRNVARQIADSARAELIIQGTILQIEPHLVLTAQLVQVDNGRVIASQRVTGETGEDIFAVIDKLTAGIKADLTLPAAAGSEPDRRVADVTTHSPEAYYHYLEGIEYLQKYFREEAAQSFNQAVQADSTFAMAYYRLADLTDPALILKAMDNLDQASRKDSYYIKSRLAEYRGDMAEFTSELRRLLDRYPLEKEAYYQLGKYFAFQCAYDSAIVYFQNALELDPIYRPAVNYLAYAYDGVGQYENAIAAINAYIALAPDEPNPYDTRGEIYARNGKIDLAIQSFQRALEIKPDFQFSIYNLAHLSCLTQDYSRAESLYQILATAEDPGTRMMGRLYHCYPAVQQGKFALGLRQLDEALAADSAEGVADVHIGFKHFLKSLIYVEQGEFNRAVEEFERHLAMYRRVYPNSVTRERQYYIQLLAQSGDMVTAERIAQSLKNDLDSAGLPLDDYWYARGCLDFARRDLDSAIAKLILTVNSDNSYAQRFMLARACLEADRLVQAVAELNTLLLRYTSLQTFFSIWNVKAHYYLGLAYEKSNWPDKAVEQYGIFLDFWKNADPGNPAVTDARERLARLRAGNP